MRTALSAATAAICFLFCSCSISVDTQDEAVLQEATFARGIDEGKPVDPGDEFSQDDKIYLYLKFAGRPKKGEVESVFWFRDQQIAAKSIDFAEVNEGVIFSFGEFTYAYFTLAFEGIPLVGEGYRAEVSLDGEPIGTYEFKIKPPEGAIPSLISGSVLAKGMVDDYQPIEPTTTFAPADTVYLVGRGDFGNGTWLEVEWYVLGEVAEAATRSITISENLSDTGFSFSFLPDEGWPVGAHSVVLVMNGREIGRYEFTVE
ncbi:MAG TPA: hypothetical protein VMX35_03180 [Acidobacteriota bacterium]|nr:hypothetical protein [Acidobacteriota bacterium]